MSECKHDLAERETACYADGLCPICLRKQLVAEREAWDISPKIRQLRRQLTAERERADLAYTAGARAQHIEDNKQLALAIEAIKDLSGYDHDRAEMWLAKLGEGK